MKEQDVRQRIESFLKRTAREVVVPASMGLGLALSGCDHAGIHVRADAASDTSLSAKPDAIVADATPALDGIASRPDTVNQPDLRLPDDVGTAPDARQVDLPVLVAPYLAVVLRDAGAEVRVLDATADVRAADAGVDADAPDAGADLGVPEAGRDVGALDAGRDTPQSDLHMIVPPYLGGIRPDAARDLATDASPYPPPPPPPYLAPMFGPPALPPDPPPPAPDPPPPAVPQPPPLAPPYLAPHFAPTAPTAAIPPAKMPE